MTWSMLGEFVKYITGIWQVGAIYTNENDHTDMKIYLQ